MSDRYTISVYVGGRIADIGYYPNWDPRSLFFEALATAMLFYDCESREEYLEKRFGTRNVVYSVEPETLPNTEENLKLLESCSEWPYLVDLTAKQIYMSCDALPPDELAKLPSALELDRVVKRRHRTRAVYCEKNGRRVVREFIDVIEVVRTPKHVQPGMDYSVFLDHCRIPFGSFDREGVMGALKDLEDALSDEVRELLAGERAISA